MAWYALQKAMQKVNKYILFGFLFCGQEGLFPRSIESLLGTTFVNYDPGRGVATIVMGRRHVRNDSCDGVGIGICWNTRRTES